MEGFLYFEEYCYDDCCANHEGWGLASKRVELSREHCRECDGERVYIPSEQTIKSVSDELISMIQASLGRKVKNGDFVSTTITVDASTPDEILLEV